MIVVPVSDQQVELFLSVIVVPQPDEQQLFIIIVVVCACIDQKRAAAAVYDHSRFTVVIRSQVYRVNDHSFDS